MLAGRAFRRRGDYSGVPRSPCQWCAAWGAGAWNVANTNSRSNRRENLPTRRKTIIAAAASLALQPSRRFHPMNHSGLDSEPSRVHTAHVTCAAAALPALQSTAVRWLDRPTAQNDAELTRSCRERMDWPRRSQGCRARSRRRKIVSRRQAHWHMRFSGGWAGQGDAVLYAGATAGGGADQRVPGHARAPKRNRGENEAGSRPPHPQRLCARLPASSAAPRSISSAS